MGAPETWSAPSSGGTHGGASILTGRVDHVGDYWMAITGSASGTANAGPTLRYATDPTGAWGTATMPAVPGTPAGVNYSQSYTFPLATDGTDYAFTLFYSTIAGTNKLRVIHATDPSGTWSAHEFDTSDRYYPARLLYADGQWVMAGQYDIVGTNDKGFVATSSTVNGTYTFSSGSAATGYDDSVGQVFITGLDYDGTTWVSSGRVNGVDSLRTSTTLTSGWTDPGVTFTGSAGQLRLQDNGYWTIIESDEVVHYTDTPTGTWSSIGTATVGISDIREITYESGYWVAVGGLSDGVYVRPEIAYCRASGPPTGQWTVVPTNGFTEPASNLRLTGIGGDGGVLVALSPHYGELRYAYVGTIPTYLRQRQSPVRSPSRVSWKAY